MLNVEKIRLMTKLSMYDKKEGKAIREVSSYYRGDYISRKVFRTLVHYTLCFLLLIALLMMMDMEDLLMHLNIPFITAAVHVLLFLYVLGLAVVLVFTYVRYARTYDELHRKSLYYMAKLDKLLQIEEDGSASEQTPKVEAGHPAKPSANAVTGEHTTAQGNGNSTAVSAREDTAWLDEPEREEEWLDDPIEPEGGWLDDPETDEGLPSNETHPSEDGIQLMRIRKKQ